MSLRSRIFLIITGVILLASGISAFIYLRQLKTPVADALEGIPNGAFCVIQTNDIRKSWDQLNQGNIIWNALNETDWAMRTTSVCSFVDSLLAIDPKINELFTGKKSWISFHCTGKSELDYIFTTTLPTVGAEEDALNFLQKNAGIYRTERKEKKGNIILTFSSNNLPVFTVAFHEGVLLLGNNEELLLTGMDQFENKRSLRTDPGFTALLDTKGDNANANVFINYPLFAAALKRFGNENSDPLLTDLSRMANWSELDLNLRPNAILMNGYSVCPDTLNGFPNVFQGQSPQTLELAAALPASTQIYCSFGISNYELYLKNYQRYADRNKTGDQRTQLLTKLRSENNFDPLENIGSWIGNEFGTAIVPSTDGSRQTFALISTSNEALTMEQLQPFSLPLDSTIFIDKNDSASVKVYKLKANGILQAAFGDMFSEFQETYFSIHHSVVICCSDPGALSSFITYLKNNATLEHNSTFADFATNMSDEASITCYAAPGRCNPLMQKNADAGFAKDLRNHAELLKKFDGVSYQISSGENDLYYTSVFLRHNPQNKKSLSTLWETQLDTTFDGRSWIVKNHKTKGNDIFVQDNSNTVYLLSSTGTIFWKRKLNGKIIGEVQQVDALKNEKLQLAFNTATSLYVIDRNGKDLEHFPVRFPSPATNPVYVLDYDNNREYRMLVACADKRIYNYTIKGTKVDGWKSYSTLDLVSTPLQRIIVANHDYVIATDRSGKTYITDRQGNFRLNLKQRLNAGSSKIFIDVGKELNKTFLISFDSIGNVTRLSMTDAIEHLHFMEFSGITQMEYLDVNGDKKKEYVFLDSKRLMIFNQDKKPINSFSFNEASSAQLKVFVFSPSDIRFGVFCPDKSELHLINNGGQESEGFPLNGETSFSLGRMNGESYAAIFGNEKNSICQFDIR